MVCVVMIFVVVIVLLMLFGVIVKLFSYKGFVFVIFLGKK